MDRVSTTSRDSNKSLTKGRGRVVPGPKGWKIEGYIKGLGRRWRGFRAHKMENKGVSRVLAEVEGVLQGP